MPVQPKHKVGRNEPCPCGSGLKFKKCHDDPTKQMICNRVANEKMVELIRIEQRKKIIRMQQESCPVCSHTGKLPDGTKCGCQFVTEEERIKYEYNKLNEGDSNGTDS